MKSKFQNRKPVKNLSNHFSPKFVELERRDVPAVYYVDPLTTGLNNGDPAVFNAGKAGQHAGIFGVDTFADFKSAYSKTTANGIADTIRLAFGDIPIDNSAGTIVIASADGPLTLDGSGAGATIIKPTTDSVAEFGANAAVFRVDAQQLNVSNLMFDGGYGSNGRAIGSFFRYQNGATGTIDKTQGQYVIFTPQNNSSGIGIVVRGSGTNVTITNSTFADYGALGVSVFNGANATIQGNSFSGGGPGNFVVYGVQVGFGSTANISGNIFTAHQGTVVGTDSSAGILITGDDTNNNFVASNATIIGNSFTNNSVGIIVGTTDINNNVVDTSNATINHNNITGSDTGIIGDNVGTINALFNWYGSTTGPFAAGNTTAAGNNPTGLGDAVDTNVLWRDVSIIPAAGVLQSKTPVAPAATAAGYRAALNKADVTLTAPSGTLNVNSLVYVVQFSEAVFDFTAADITLTNGKITSLVDNGGGKYTVTVARTKADDVTFVIPASGVGIDNLPTIRTALFAGTNASATSKLVFPFTRGFAAAGDVGSLQPFFGVDQNFATRTGTVPFEANYGGGVRVATADFNNDGTLDVVVAAGINRAAQVKIYDGATTKLLADFIPFEAGYTQGTFVTTGDFNGDGVPDVVVSPDVGGGPRVRIVDGKSLLTNTVVSLADFFAIQDPGFFGGVRVGAGDINGDGKTDIAVAAGFGGGPRIAVYSGAAITPGGAFTVKLRADFFAFSPSDASTLRDGAYVAVGDVDGDGFADVVVGAGEGGGPRVQGYSGKLIATSLTNVANFFAGNVNGAAASTGGARVAVKDIDLDGKFDIVTAPGKGGGATIGVFLGSNPNLIDATLAPDRVLDLFGDFNNGAFVG